MSAASRVGALRHSSLDAVLVLASLAHAVLLVTLPSAPVVALGLWWNANTVAHNFIHRPFFRLAWHNGAYSMFLSAVLGFPQSAWRERHRAHHAGRPVRVRLTPRPMAETTIVAGVWAAWAGLAPHTFLFAYLPGWIGGLLLCRLQGHFEHAHGTTSHYGRLYNLLFFNDGYHVEHHRAPGRHWSELPACCVPGRASRWPPVMRWMDALTLEGLERLVVASPRLQRVVMRVHERALRRLLPAFAHARTVVVVGGGLFPRTTLLLRRLLPQAQLTIVDVSAEHLQIARTFLGDDVVCRAEFFVGDRVERADLVVIPLAFLGDRRMLYERPPGRLMLVHDWIWHRRQEGAAIAVLLKRINVVRPPERSLEASGAQG